jgi:IS4 transposase
VLDRGYTDYDRYCELKSGSTDFVTLLRSNARTEVVERIHDFEVQDEVGTRRITDDRIELGETEEEFRRVTVEDTDGEVTEYLTTLPAEEYDPVDIVSIYTLRWLIEILFRELKQYTNVQEFHSKSFNGALFELFCTLIAYLLVEWFRHRHPLRGGVPNAIYTIRNKWNKPLPEYG